MILDWLKPSRETIEASIYTSMWCEGYTDSEIEQYLKEYFHDVKV
jgi:hypothetical protein